MPSSSSSIKETESNKKIILDAIVYLSFAGMKFWQEIQMRDIPGIKFWPKTINGKPMYHGYLSFQSLQSSRVKLWPIAIGLWSLDFFKITTTIINAGFTAFNLYHTFFHAGM